MKLRTFLVAGNWKMNKNCDEAVLAVQYLVTKLSEVKNIDIFLAPAFTSLFVVKGILENSNISLAAQNVFWEKSGAFTGEISSDMLKGVGCDYAILGHSERRHFFAETDEIVNKKVKAILEANIFPVLCIGETEADRQKGKTFAVLDKQIRVGLKDISSDYFARIILAYEPVWAIGSGNTATNDQIQEVHSFIRVCLEKLSSPRKAEGVRILYGGAVGLNNIERLMILRDIDGVLVGGASLEPDSFSKLVFLASELSKLTGRG